MAITLTDKRIPGLPKGVYRDQNGLRLKVQSSGGRQWVWRGTVNGRRVDYGLGPAALMGVDEAREEAARYRRMARAGQDPKPGRRQAPTFAEMAEQHLPHKRHDWTGASAAKQERDWQAALETYILPRLGRRPVDSITTGDIQAIVNGLMDKPAMARRVKMQVRAVLQWAVQMDHRQGNPAEQVKAARSTTEHHEALPPAQVAGALAKVRESSEWRGAVLALHFAVLTAVRHGEARGASWGEVDLEAATWTIPPGRMKARKEHRVPLSQQAVAVLREAKELADGSGLVFPAAKGGRLNDSILPKLASKLKLGCTPHGFRSSFRDWCGMTGQPGDLAESALAHTRQGVEGAYYRSDLFEQRRALMEAWGDYISPNG